MRIACACETWRKRLGRTAAVAAVAVVLLVPVSLNAAPPATSTPAVAAVAEATGRADGAVQATAAQHREANAEEATRAGHTEAHEESSIWGLVGKIVNFVVLVGILVYFLRSPMGQYVTDRNRQVRNDLVTATRMKEEATAQIADIQQKLDRLPGELDALRARGQEEIAAEEARITREAQAERERLLEQTRREIDVQLRIAKRDLVNHAADLAVQVARDRISTRITDEDQQHLVNRYLEQVKQA